MEINLEAKALICSTAVDFIEYDDVIYIGPGTTEDFIIKHLKKNKKNYCGDKWNFPY